MIRERNTLAVPGIFMAFVLLVMAALSVLWLIQAAGEGLGGQTLAAIGLLIASALSLRGLVIVNPNEAQVVTLFGNYEGSLRNSGLWWVNPFTMRNRVSLRVRNFESTKLKVNDYDGNPIEIAAVVVWKVVDSAEAVFEVDSYENFVTVQCEAAVRNLATSHPYDAHTEGQMSLRSQSAEIADQLRQEIQARLEKAGVRVVEARLSHLAYAPEIASAMLRRQQASAVVAARQKIVEGAVGMVEMALEGLAKKQIVSLDEERKAAMVSNLLVVLCSEQNTQPVVNAGTLYH